MVGLAVWSVWPIVRNPLDSVTDTWDSVFIVWQMNSNIQKIAGNLGTIFEGNIYYPYEHTKAYSDLFIPSSILSWLSVKLTGEPVAATSTMIILGQILLVLMLFGWLREFSKNNYAAILGTSAFSLSQIRFHYQVHLQMWMMVWMLLAMYFIWKYAKAGKSKYIYFSFLLIAIQVWESPLPVYFYSLFLVIIGIFNRKKFKENLKHLMIAGIMFLVLSFPVIKVYFDVSNEFNYVRPIREAAHFSASVDDYWNKFLSPGLYIIAAISLIILFTQKSINKKIFKFFSLSVFLSFMMSLGPVLKWGGQTVKLFGNIFIPLPYGILYYVIPGFGGFRTPSRWIWLFGLFLSFLIAYAFRNWKFKKNVLVSVGLILLSIFGGTKIINAYKIPTVTQYPQVYKWLKDQPGNVILEYPMYTWGAGDIAKTESYRMIYSLYHRKNLVNGYSGFSPPEWEKLVSRVDINFPNEEINKELSVLGVNYVIVDKIQSDESVKGEIRENYKSSIAWEDKGYLVLRIKNRKRPSVRTYSTPGVE